MTTRDTAWPEGTPCWVDLAVDDFDQAREFYGSLFGWDIPDGDPEFGGYTTCTKDGKNVAGMAPKMSPDQPSVWTAYLATNDLAATLAKVREAGGQVVADAMEIATMGSMGLAVDPGGAFVGFWQSGSHTGFDLVNEPGSVTWSENFSRVWQQNQEFYTAVLGWEYDDMSEGGFEYAVFKVAGEAAGGIGQMSEEMPGDVPPYWNNYFNVADTDKALKKVEKLGGVMLQEAWDTPFGRMAAVADDQGAPFMLMADAPKK